MLSIAGEFSVTPGPPEPDNEHDARGQQHEQEALDGQDPKLIGTIQAVGILDRTLDRALSSRVAVTMVVRRYSAVWTRKSESTPTRLFTCRSGEI